MLYGLCNLQLQDAISNLKNLHRGLYICKGKNFRSRRVVSGDRLNKHMVTNVILSSRITDNNSSVQQQQASR